MSVPVASSSSVRHWLLLLIAGLLAAVGVLIGGRPAAAAAPGFSAGTVFVCEVSAHRVLELRPGGAQTTVGTGLLSPAGVAVSASGDVFISDTDQNRVVKIAAGSNVQTDVGTGLNRPIGLAVDAAGDLFISEPDTSQVLKLPADGSAQSAVGTGWAVPAGLAVDAAGDLFISDYGTNRVVKVPADGSAQTTLGTGLLRPQSVTVSTAGDVFIADTGHYRLVKVPADGSAQTTLVTGLKLPAGVALDAAGDLYIADAIGNKVVRVSADASAQTVFTTAIHPFALAIYEPPPTFTADTPPARATTDRPYRYTYAATVSNGEPAATFRLASGTLPPGLTLNPATGALSGTPTAAGSYHFRIQTENAANATLGPPSTITVGKVMQVIRFTSKPPPHSTVGATYRVSATGGGSGNPVTFSLDPASTASACTVTAAGLVRLTEPGTCIITANQAGNTTYAAAARVSQRLTVSAAAPPKPELAATGPRPFRPILTATVLLVLGGVAVRLAGRRRGRA